jgi:NAD(P)-dependent dehydrogenase (short-subunit alcohol dehydrogenase family)
MILSENIRPLQNQTALVTHATTDTGVAIVKALAEAGSKVMINYQDEREKAEQLAEYIRNKQGQVMIFQADISQESQVKSMLDVVIAYWGRLDILVNNLDSQEHAVLELVNIELWHKAVSYNLAIEFLRATNTTRHFLQHADKTQSTDLVGKLICVASKLDANSKQSLAKLLEILLREFSAEKICVYGIALENS